MESLSPSRVAKTWNTRLRHFDFFPKPLEDIRERATVGAIITIVGVLIMSILFFDAAYTYVFPPVESTIFVDTTRDKTMTLQFDILFVYLDCKEVNFDVVGVDGQNLIHITENISKKPVDGEAELLSRNLFGRVLFGAISGGKNPTKGCHTVGTIDLHKVEGNLHIAAGSSFAEQHTDHKHHIHTLRMGDITFNISHLINHFSFGPQFPYKSNPLNGQFIKEAGTSQVNYLLKLVPIVFEKDGGREVKSFEFSVTEQKKRMTLGARTFPLPGVFFKWEISPFMVKYSEKGSGFARFLTRICAITGGIFVILGIVYRASRNAYFVLKEKES